MSSMQALTTESANFRRHFDQLRGTEHAKNDLIEVFPHLAFENCAEASVLACSGSIQYIITRLSSRKA